MGKTPAAQDGLAEKHRRDESPQSVDGLSKVQPPWRCLRIAELRDIGIGGRLKETHARSDDKEDGKIDTIYIDL